MSITLPKESSSAYSVTSALRSERYDLNSDSTTLDRRLLKEAGPSREHILRRIWGTANEADRLEALYAFPQTVREAHLLLSHDRARIRDSFRWVLSKAPFVGPIVDLGCGTGTLLRILAQLFPSYQLVGVERAPNLVAIGRELTQGVENIAIIEGSYDTMELQQAPFGTLVCVCGLEFLDQPIITVREEHAVGDGVVPTSTLAWAINQCRAVLSHWRGIVEDGASLIVVARLATVASIGAFITVAARAGWSFDFQASSRAAIGSELMPALVFRAGASHEPDQLQRLVTWVRC